jgi:hypothetical protein
MSNVIDFPFDRIKKPTDDIGAYIDNIAEEIVSDVIAFLMEEGVDIKPDDHVYDISLFYEVTRSLLMKMHGRHHMMQNIANDMYKWLEYDLEEKQLEFDF